ncbi:MAG: hypothetical protein ACRYFX_08165 [Janthinobacterium lividum]
MHKYTFFIICWLANVGQLLAQDRSTPVGKEPVGVQSPTAASLGTFGDVSISQYTGSPNIELPVYTVQSNGITVPIALHYNASGFRPDEHPGWVGMGWSLQAGGVITRVVNRMPDEYADPSKTNSTSNIPALGYYYTNEILNPSSINWDSQSFAEQISSRTITTNYINQYPYPNNGGYTQLFADTEPDEFSFTLPGLNGTFYKDSDGNGTLQGRGTWKVRCDQPVKVEVNNLTQPLLTIPFMAFAGGFAPNGGTWATQYAQQYPKTFSGFTITLADGTRYIFGHDQGSAAPAERPAIEYSIGLFDQSNDYWTANAWYLTKIVSPDGNEITFAYEREAFQKPGRFISQVYNFIRADLALEAGTPPNNPTTTGGSPYFYGYYWNATSSCTYQFYPNEYTSITGKLVAPVYLRSIASRVGEVQFERSISKELRYIPEIAYKAFSPQGTGGPISQTNYPYIVTALHNKASFAESIAQLQWQQLDNIIIKAQGQVLKKVHLTYTSDLTQRLTLLSAQETGGDGMPKPAYGFTYYNNNQNLPNYLMLASDHWGFYNNTSTQASPTGFSNTPNFPDFYKVYNSYFKLYAFPNVPQYDLKRAPTTDPTVYLRGSLTRITYPTGGYSEFEYEQHQYGSRVDTMRTFLDPAQTTTLTAGGLRIKKITSATIPNPGIGDKTVTEYYYVTGYTAGTNVAQLPSSGVLTGQPKYRYKRTYPMYVGGQPAIKGYYRTNVFCSQSVIPACGNVQGSHIGYSQVVEKRNDGSYTKYYFTNFKSNFDSDTGVNLDNDHFDEPPVVSLERTSGSQGTAVYNQYSSREHERGRLLQVAAYNSNGQCVQRRRIQYASYANGSATDYARIISGKQLNFNSICTVAYYGLEGTSYKLFTYPFLPSSETTTTYDATGNNGIATTTTYQYKTFQNRSVNIPAEQTTTDSKGQSLTTRYRYPFEYTNSSTSATDQVAWSISSLPGLYRLSEPVEVLTLRNGALTGAVVQTYTYPGTNTALIKPYKTWQLELTQSIPLSQYTSASFTGTGAGTTFSLDPNLHLKATCTDYDTRGNLLGLLKEGDVASGYQWGYAGTLPTATVQNAPISQVIHENFEETTTWGPNLAYDATVAWTGRRSARFSYGSATGTKFEFGPATALPPSIGRRRVRFSCWAKSDGPNAQLFLYMQPWWASTINNSYTDYVQTSGSTNGQWVLLQKEVDVPTDVTTIFIRPGGLRSAGIAGQNVWIDDIRVQPVDAQVTTYTHDPLVGPTSATDANNRPTRYEYDGLQRLQLVRDAEGNVTKHLEYHYQQ